MLVLGFFRFGSNQVGQQGNEEGCGFTGSGLGLSGDIIALKRLGEYLFLNRGTEFVTGSGDSL